MSESAKEVLARVLDALVDTGRYDPAKLAASQLTALEAAGFVIVPKKVAEKNPNQSQLCG